VPEIDSAETHDCRIVILSGPSGSGKSTIVNRLLEAAPVKLVKSVSATTRPPRAGETDGDDYYFLATEEFETRRANGELLECARVHGFWYGTLKSELQRARDADAWAVLEIDVQGALRVMDEHPNAVTIFLTTSEPQSEQRLRSRGTEPEHAIQRRLETARDELKSAYRYRYQVVNDELDRAVQEISDILSSQETELHA
jgi:guanylate kinase